MSKFRSVAVMIAMIAAATFSLIAQKPFLLTGQRLNFGSPSPIYTLYDANNRQIVLAQDGEMRWFDDIKKPPVKTAKIKEVPEFDYSPEEKKDIADITKAHQAMFGDIPENFFGGASLILRPGGREFCLTDRDSKFYFYSTETGELLRKVTIQKPTHKYGPRTTSLSDDNKIVLTESTHLNKSYIHSMETGKLLLEIDSPFLDSSELSRDGLTLFHLHKNILSRYSTKTGKKSGADITIESDSAGVLIVSPYGDKIAFNLYTKGNYDGQAIMTVDSGRILKCDATLKHFSVNAFTPDGKLLAVSNDRGYMHFIDTTTGLHSFSYVATFSDLWTRANAVAFSPDSTKMSFATGEYDMPYYIYLDLMQPRVRRVVKLEP